MKGHVAVVEGRRLSEAEFMKWLHGLSVDQVREVARFSTVSLAAAHRELDAVDVRIDRLRAAYAAFEENQRRLASAMQSGSPERQVAESLSRTGETGAPSLGAVLDAIKLGEGLRRLIGSDSAIERESKFISDGNGRIVGKHEIERRVPARSK